MAHPRADGDILLLLAFCLVLGVMELGTGDSSAPVQEDALLESAQEEESEAEESALQAASREEAALFLGFLRCGKRLEESSQGAVGLAFSCYEEPQPITEEELPPPWRACGTPFPMAPIGTTWVWRNGMSSP